MQNVNARGSLVVMTRVTLQQKMCASIIMTSLFVLFYIVSMFLYLLYPTKQIVRSWTIVIAICCC